MQLEGTGAIVTNLVALVAEAEPTNLGALVPTLKTGALGNKIETHELVSTGFHWIYCNLLILFD